MKQDDFVEIMRELVPRMIDQSLSRPQDSEDNNPSSASGMKRPAEDVEDTTVEPPASKARTEEHLQADSESSSEVLSVQDIGQLCQLWDTAQSIEVLAAAYMQKRAAKELPAVGNPS